MQLAARPSVTAGVALASACILAAAPVAHQLPEVHAPAIDLTSVEDIVTDSFSGVGGVVAGLANEAGAADVPAGLIAESLNPSAGLYGITVANLSSWAQQLATSPLVESLTNRLEMLATSPLVESLASSPWVELFSNTIGNLQALGAGIQADPLPILAQVIANQLVNTQTTTTTLQTFGKAANTWFATEFPQALLLALRDMKASHVTDAVTTMNGAIFDLLYQALPILELGSIPVSMTDNLYKATNALNSSLLIPLGYGALPMFFEPSVALGDSVQAFLDAAEAGNFPAALGALVNAPPEVLNAFLNGGLPLNLPGTGALLPETGLLSGPTAGPGGEIGGAIYSLLVSVPRAIAQAIGASTPNAAASSVATAGLGNVGAMLNTTFGNLGTFANTAASLIPQIGNLLQPGALAGFGSLLTANLVSVLMRLITSL